MSDHLVSLALWTAFPSALAGRDSGDYYETSVAIGLASRRRSRVRPCCTYRAERRWPTHLLECPHWASLRAPEVAAVRDGSSSLKPGADVIVLTWLDRAKRDVLVVHPRGDVSRPQEGVFSTRSPHRPNPIGLHRVTILAVEETRVLVRNLEAIDGTPIVDVKPVLGGADER